MKLTTNVVRSLWVLFAAAALSGCASEPVKEIKGIFQRGTVTDATAAVDGESKGDAKADARLETNKVEGKPQPQRAAPSPKPEIQGAPELVAGIKLYEDGKYREASKTLRSAVPRLNKADQVKAHKYLAFIECASGRKSQCRDEFAKALKIDPSFELEPSEAGHPLWGPVFRSVKQKARR
jgi:tetratricopeptide (TPR) repeat protein